MTSQLLLMLIRLRILSLPELLLLSLLGLCRSYIEYEFRNPNCLFVTLLPRLSGTFGYLNLTFLDNVQSGYPFPGSPLPLPGLGLLSLSLCSHGTGPGAQDPSISITRSHNV